MIAPSTFANATEPDQFTIVIVLSIRDIVIGMVVVSVSDVTTLTPAQIRPVPDMSGAMDTSCLLGLGTVDDRMLILVDIDKLMASDDIGLVHKVAA